MSRERASAAPTVQRLGALLQGGISPVAAWQAVADASDGGPAARFVASRVRSSHEIPDALVALVRSESDSEWAPVCAAWRVAADAGAALGPALLRLAQVMRRTERADAQVRTALTGPIATARILIALPVVGLLLGLVLGFDTGRVLFTTPPGWACLVLGVVLLGAAALWTRALLRTARSREPSPGLGAELVAIGLAGSLGPDAALERADDALARAGLDVDPSVRATLDFARSAGVPAAGLLRAEADDARRRAADRAERRAAALGVRLMLPLGLCILPSFIVLGVVPILLALLGSMNVGTLELG